jgi:GR25 family glycosyltransferase involved in LPS biosynthesis
VSRQFKNLGIENPERFPAIKHEKGYIGCIQSHIRCLEMAIERGYEQVFICEDDIQFTDVDTFKKSLTEFHNDNIRWDVLIIGGNNHKPFEVVKDSYIKIYDCQTTTGYVIGKHYYHDLLKNFRESFIYLQNKPEGIDEKTHYFNFALDQYWKKLQRRDFWYMITPLTVIQALTYSDIEKCFVSYEKCMLHHD